MNRKAQFTKASSDLGKQVSLSFSAVSGESGSSVFSCCKQASFHSNPWTQTNIYRLNILGCDPKSTDLHLLIILLMPSVTTLDNLSELWFASFSLKTLAVSNGPRDEFCILNLVQFQVILGCSFTSFKCSFTCICILFILKEEVIFVLFCFVINICKGPQGNNIFS